MKRTHFSFNAYPYRIVYYYNTESQEHKWIKRLEELPHKGIQEESQLSADERDALYRKRNEGGDIPLVNCTTQYAMGCFEGLKAYPCADGSYNLFRVDANAQRFYNSMQGLYMPPFPTDYFIESVLELLTKSIALGYAPPYNPEDKDNDFMLAKSIYVRPFTLADTGYKISTSNNPFVFFVATEVGNYFTLDDEPSIFVSDKIRATPNGTGWIKSSSNYVISCLAKNEAIDKGYTECLFLDCTHQKFVEECSSCNIFFVLDNDTIVTPQLSDTVLPGITRNSVIQLIRENNIAIEERQISIEEVFDSAVECFSTGTAVGINHFGILTYNNNTKHFGNKRIGNVASSLRKQLKGIQHGEIEDKYSWITKI